MLVTKNKIIIYNYIFLIILTFFNDFVSAESAVALSEAIRLSSLGYCVQHCRDVCLRAFGELVVVVAVAARGRREHDVVADLAPGSTIRWIVVLK
jgi:hypothetical protein